METRTVGHLKSTTFFKSNSLRILTRSSSTYYNDILSHYLLFAFLMLFFFFLHPSSTKKYLFFSSCSIKQNQKKKNSANFWSAVLEDVLCDAQQNYCPTKHTSTEITGQKKKSIVLWVGLLALEQKHHWCSKNKCGKSTKMSVIVKSTMATCIL